MSVEILLYYKGTPLPAPVKTLKEFENFKRIAVSQGNGYAMYIQQLNVLENALFEYDKKVNKAGLAVDIERYLAKAWKGVFGDKYSATSLWTFWCLNIVCLVEAGELPQDDMNGWTISSRNKKTKMLIINMSGNVCIPTGADWTNPTKELCQDLLKTQKNCRVCGVPSKNKCEKCIAYYCCREHQVQDWKAGHKQSCGKLTL
jgi:hypothetical protein